MLTQGNLADLVGRREEAVVRYKRVVELKTRWISSRSVQLAKEGLATPFQSDGVMIGARGPDE